MNQTIYFRKQVWEKFKDEPQKSELVNLLLSRHYDFYKPGTLIETIGEKDLDTSVVGNKELAKKLRESKKAVDTVAFCKHAAVKGFCKKGCK